MAGFYTALIDPAPTIQWPALSPPCTKFNRFGGDHDFNCGNGDLLIRIAARPIQEGAGQEHREQAQPDGGDQHIYR